MVNAGSEQLGQEQKPQLPELASQQVLRRAVRWGVPVVLALAVLCGGIGWLVSGQRGLIGAALGAVIGGALLLLTAGSIILANKALGSPSYVIVFFVTVMGGWLLKFVAFIVAAVLLREQPWLDPLMLFIGLIAGVLATVIIDVVVIAKSRIPLQVAGV